MSDLAMTQFLADKPIGATVIVKAKYLQLSAEQFDSVVRGWIASNGGPGFWYVGSHAENQSGKRLYDLITVQRMN